MTKPSLSTPRRGRRCEVRTAVVISGAPFHINFGAALAALK